MPAALAAARGAAGVPEGSNGQHTCNNKPSKYFKWHHCCHTLLRVLLGATRKGRSAIAAEAQACKTASSMQKQPLLAGSVLHALLCAR